MQQLDTHDRIAKQCMQEAIAVQDMLSPGQARESLLKKIVQAVQLTLFRKNRSSPTAFPATPFPVSVLFDVSAAGPPFELWFEAKKPTGETRMASPDDLTSSPEPA